MMCFQWFSSWQNFYFICFMLLYMGLFMWCHYFKKIIFFLLLDIHKRKMYSRNNFCWMFFMNFFCYRNIGIRIAVIIERKIVKLQDLKNCFTLSIKHNILCCTVNSECMKIYDICVLTKSFLMHEKEETTEKF